MYKEENYENIFTIGYKNTYRNKEKHMASNDNVIQDTIRRLKETLEKTSITEKNARYRLAIKDFLTEYEKQLEGELPYSIALKNDDIEALKNPLYKLDANHTIKETITKITNISDYKNNISPKLNDQHPIITLLAPTCEARLPKSNKDQNNSMQRICQKLEELEKTSLYKRFSLPKQAIRAEMKKLNLPMPKGFKNMLGEPSKEDIKNLKNRMQKYIKDNRNAKQGKKQPKMRGLEEQAKVATKKSDTRNKAMRKNKHRKSKKANPKNKQQPRRKL